MTRRIIGFALNAVLRATNVAFLLDVLRHPHDPRYEGKAIPARNLVIVGGLGLAFPLLHLMARRRLRWSCYPVWSDNLYLSIFWLDMAGNYFNLYNRYLHFDLIPHFHGTGAFAGVLYSAFDQPPLAAIGATNLIHSLLEAQEYLTDVFCGTHNVRGAWDSAGDLSSGFLGTIAYVGIAGIARACQPKSP